MFKCYICPYYDRRLRVCDYLLMTGKRRGCSIDDCTIYTIGKVTRKRKATTDDKVERLEELYNEGLNDKEIAEKTGVSKIAVCRWRHRNKLPHNRYANKPKSNRTRTHKKGDAYIENPKYAIVRELYNEGLNDKEIAAKVGMHQKSIFRWRKDNKLLSNTPFGKKEVEK